MKLRDKIAQAATLEHVDLIQDDTRIDFIRRAGFATADAAIKIISDDRDGIAEALRIFLRERGMAAMSGTLADIIVKHFRED